MSEADLTFIGTEELIAELMRRHKALLIVREQVAPTDASRTDTYFDFDGGVNSAIGMAERARCVLIDKVKRDILFDSDGLR